MGRMNPSPLSGLTKTIQVPPVDCRGWGEGSEGSKFKDGLMRWGTDPPHVQSPSDDIMDKVFYGRGDERWE